MVQATCRRGEELLLPKCLHVHLANVGLSFCCGEMVLKMAYNVVMGDVHEGSVSFAEVVLPLWVELLCSRKWSSKVPSLIIFCRTSFLPVVAISSTKSSQKPVISGVLQGCWGTYTGADTI